MRLPFNQRSDCGIDEEPGPEPRFVRAPGFTSITVLTDAVMCLEAWKTALRHEVRVISATMKKPERIGQKKRSVELILQMLTQ